MPARAFGYGELYEYYEDDVYSSASSSNCGPTGTSLCWLWSQSYEGNSYYLSSVDNGMGLLGMSAASQYMVTALVLLAAVTVDAVARRGRAAIQR